MRTATSAIVWGAAPIVAFGVIMAVAIGWDRYGGRRRRDRLARALADWQARAAEYNPQADVAVAEIGGTE